MAITARKRATSITVQVWLLFNMVLLIIHLVLQYGLLYYYFFHFFRIYFIHCLISDQMHRESGKLVHGLDLFEEKQQGESKPDFTKGGIYSTVRCVSLSIIAPRAFHHCHCFLLSWKSIAHCRKRKWRGGISDIFLLRIYSRAKPSKHWLSTIRTIRFSCFSPFNPSIRLFKWVLFTLRECVCVSLSGIGRSLSFLYCKTTIWPEIKWLRDWLEWLQVPKSYESHCTAFKPNTLRRVYCGKLQYWPHESDREFVQGNSETSTHRVFWCPLFSRVHDSQY